MYKTWEGIVQILGVGVPLPARLILAQETTTTTTEVLSGTDAIFANLGTSFVSLINAIIILLVGIIVAWIASGLVKGLLSRTDIDNKIAAWVTGGQPGVESPPIEKWISGIVFWIVMILTAVAVLDSLNLNTVSAPLNSFLEQILGYLPQLAGAAILLGIAWLVATVVKLVVTRALRALNLDERFSRQVEERPERAGEATPPTTSGFSLAETISNVAYWFIFLLFLPSILSTLELEGTLLPVQQMLNDILAILPNILAAIVIAAVGWLVAQVVRRIVTNLLVAVGTDQFGARFGLNQATGTQSLSWILGTIVYVLILIPVGIAALNALNIAAISVPATAMLQQILNALPKIFTAAVILVIAYVLGKFASELVANILTGFGFNNIFQWMGVSSARVSRRTPVPPPTETSSEGLNPPPPSTGPETTLQSSVPTRTPSEIVGIIVLVGIMLFAIIAAVEILEIAALTAIVSGLLLIFGQILAGLIVFAVGLYLANLSFNLITSSGSRQSRILGNAARIAIIAFSLALGLQQMGIASDIVNLAFGLLLGAIAVAIALAFGLGGRDVAAGQVREWLSSFKGNKPTDI
ncbi:mechanosensitive ion channel [Lyngbya aestuarii]|uniref:mechanosensitive ion channel n=1 Tax=Lyngbya aestuarii TaxID=118322 RepID=UPI00403DE5C0